MLKDIPYEVRDVLRAISPPLPGLFWQILDATLYCEKKMKDINSSTPDVVVQLGRMMRDRNFENGNYNIRKGEMGVEMFFVLHGCAEWCYGEYFGEACPTGTSGRPGCSR